MSNSRTCQRGGRTFAVAAGGPGSAGGAAGPIMNSFPPHRPDQSAKVDQRQPSRDSQSRSSVFLPLYSITGRGTGVLGERKCWRTNSSEVSGAQTSQPFSRAQPRSLPHQLSEEKLLRKSQTSTTIWFQAKAGSFSSRG